RNDLQISGYERIGPGRVATRTPSFISELKPRRTVSRQQWGVEVSREIRVAIALVNCVYVRFKESPRPRCVRRNDGGSGRNDHGRRACGDEKHRERGFSGN